MALWKVVYEGQAYALRVFRPGMQEDCEREQAVMAATHAAGLPVPEVHRAGIWQGRPVLLITWLAGRIIADELHTHPWHLWRVGIAFGRMQAKIHAVPAPDLLRQRATTWIAWKCDGEQTLQEHLHRLSLNETALLHLDYHPRNVLTDGKQITGVVDWTNAHAGEPRVDVARTLSILRLDPHVRKPLLRRLSTRIFEVAWRIGYQREHGHLQGMPIFYAWAGSVLLHDLARRYQHNPQELSPAHHWTNKWKARADCQDVKAKH